MVYNVYAIEDVLVGFHAPMISVSDEVMIRDYKAWASKKSKEEAADLRLFKIGMFNDNTGFIEPMKPECIIGGLENA